MEIPIPASMPCIIAGDIARKNFPHERSPKIIWIIPTRNIIKNSFSSPRFPIISTTISISPAAGPET